MSSRLLTQCVTVAVSAAALFTNCLVLSSPAQAQTPVPITQPVSTMTPAQIHALVAPVALYTDGLLSQMFLASTYPADIAQAQMMAPSYAQMPADQAAEAIRLQPWDPSVKFLFSFPQVLSMMATQPEWTRQIGDLYRTRPIDLMKSVQAMRQLALKTGSLKSGPQINVVVDAQGQIVISPVNPNVVYIPQYNPTVVYGAWAYPAYPPYPVYNPSWGAVAFGAGIAAGALIWATPHWRTGTVVVNRNTYNNFTRRYGYPGVYNRPAPVRPVPAVGRQWHGNGPGWRR